MPLKINIELDVDAVHIHVHGPDEAAITAKLNQAAADLDDKTNVLQTTLDETTT